MNNGPWPAPKDKDGFTFVTIDGVRYQVEGTGHSLLQLTRSIRNGLGVERLSAAAIVGDDVGGKGEK